MAPSKIAVSENNIDGNLWIDNAATMASNIPKMPRMLPNLAVRGEAKERMDKIMSKQAKI